MLLPVAAAVFTVYVGDQLVMEYDFGCSIVPVRALLPIESNEPLVDDDGVTIGADDIVLPEDPYEYDIDGAALADETLYK